MTQLYLRPDTLGLDRFMELLGFGEYNEKFECYESTDGYEDPIELHRAQRWFALYLGRDPK